MFFRSDTSNLMPHNKRGIENRLFFLHLSFLCNINHFTDLFPVLPVLFVCTALSPQGPYDKRKKKH